MALQCTNTKYKSGLTYRYNRATYRLLALNSNLKLGKRDQYLDRSNNLNLKISPEHTLRVNSLKSRIDRYDWSLRDHGADIQRWNRWRKRLQHRDQLLIDLWVFNCDSLACFPVTAHVPGRTKSPGIWLIHSSNAYLWRYPAPLLDRALLAVQPFSYNASDITCDILHHLYRHITVSSSAAHYLVI